MASRLSRSARGWLAARLTVPAPAFLLAAVVLCPGGAPAQTLQDRIAACAACHGETGQAPNPDIPSIGGQPKLFVMYQLFFYREGRRKSPEMNTVAKDMSDADLTALSEYVAALPPPKRLEDSVDQARYLRGAELASKRICGSCHNPDFSGREQMARIAGQREAYLLKSFK